MKNMISRRNFLAAAGVVAAAGVLTACGGSSSTAASAAGSTAAAASGDTIKVGEETGKLDAMLLSTADDYEYESSAAIKSMMSIIEPLMIVILGIVVAGVMVSVLVPMCSMYGNIDENTTAVFAWIGRTLGRFLG